MNTDIRLSVTFWDHPKTVKLERRLGLQGVKSLQILWMWVATNCPDGSLTNVQRPFNEEDIEIVARWNGDENTFVNTLVELGWLDKNEHGYTVHGWVEHNSWAAKSSERGDKARFSRLAKIAPDIFLSMKEQGITSLTRDEYESAINETSTKRQRNVNDALTPAPAPAPAPSPTPIVKGGKRFSPPSLSDVKEYCQSRGNGVDHEKWFNFYSAKGWMIGKNKMKDWKAAIHTWEEKKTTPVNGKDKCKSCQYEQSAGCIDRTQTRREACTSWVQG